MQRSTRRCSNLIPQLHFNPGPNQLLSHKLAFTLSITTLNRKLGCFQSIRFENHFWVWVWFIRGSFGTLDILPSTLDMLPSTLDVLPSTLDPRPKDRLPERHLSGNKRRQRYSRYQLISKYPTGISRYLILAAIARHRVEVFRDSSQAFKHASWFQSWSTWYTRSCFVAKQLRDKLHTQWGASKRAVKISRHDRCIFSEHVFVLVTLFVFIFGEL